MGCPAARNVLVHAALTRPALLALLQTCTTPPGAHPVGDVQEVGAAVVDLLVVRVALAVLQHLDLGEGGQRQPQ